MVRTKGVVAPALALALTLVVACVSYTAAMRPDEPVDPQRSYFYGRFYINSRPTPDGLDGYQTMGFVLRCDDGRSYTIRFSNKREVQVIKARPATCMLYEAVYTDDNGIVHKHVRPPADWAHLEAFAPGRAYYLGDYFAKADLEAHPYWAKWSWFMNQADDNYESTTAEMRRRFAPLASLPVEDRRLAPRLHPPGWGTVAGGADPIPMSPQRVARLALLTGRSYATPAACKADCATGDCLPFRDEAGVAMTCVVHCKADRDCPEGLGCNCTKGGGADCRSIATEPGDPMDGICLNVEPAVDRRDGGAVD